MKKMIEQFVYTENGEEITVRQTTEGEGEITPKFAELIIDYPDGMYVSEVYG